MRASFAYDMFSAPPLAGERTGCGKWLGPPKIGLAALRASVALPSREHRIIGSTFLLRLSAYRWSPEEFLERGEVGALRSMKMGTTPSPCLYDAAVRRALQSVNLRRPAILHHASWAGVLPVSQRGRLSLRYRLRRSIPGST